ncbi:hypothetical protein QO200_04245 [Flavobacterium sp. Arc3]|uniref:hypothetical protein n=1 Tax=unclassified Flavobacterium TaxID=196869 RepID=UPI00352F5C8B
MARILDNEKAEILGPLDDGSVFTGVAGAVISCVFSTTISCGFTRDCNGAGFASVAFV